MGAFRRRTVFAAPLIMIAGCGAKDAPRREPDPPRPKLPGESWSVYKQGTSCRAGDRSECPVGDSCNPPPPRDIECPPGIGDTNVIVAVKADSTCVIVPKDCLDIACATRATPCPDPYDAPAKLRGPVWNIHRDPSSKTACIAYDANACLPPPDGQPAPPCNPPPPQAVVCPAALGDKPEMIRAAKLPNERCAIVAADCKDLSCVKEADLIECPLPIGQKLP
jgi:hypothetical protein